MDGILKQSTAVTVKIGKFVDSTDGNTAENGLTITQSDVLLSKNGGALTQKNEASNTTVDGATGYYDADLDTTDTNTLGILKLVCHMAGALYVEANYMVVTANYYDSVILGTDVQTADVTRIGGVVQSATDLKDLVDTGYDPADHKVQGVVLTDTCTTNTDLVTAADVNMAVEAGDLALILADTDELQTDWANGGRLDTIIDSLALEATVAALNNIAAADVWTVAMEGAVTAKEQMNINHAVLAGKSSGGGTNTIKFRDAADSKDRVESTVTADGDRIAINNDGA